MINAYWYTIDFKFSTYMYIKNNIHNDKLIISIMEKC